MSSPAYFNVFFVVFGNGFIYQNVSLSENGVASVFIKKDILETYGTTASEAFLMKTEATPFSDSDTF
jgi:nanoRNase/pAp phosphatase (c-di-AMP/oligoRNAs hydrolase)